MIVGFTGTQVGMSVLQASMLDIRLRELRATELHHGDCVGADAQAHSIAMKLGLRVVIHPPANQSKRARCQGAIVIHNEKPYLERNHDIVDACEVLLATPRTPFEEVRSGTWATVRYARKCKKRVEVII